MLMRTYQHARPSFEAQPNIMKNDKILISLCYLTFSVCVSADVFLDEPQDLQSPPAAQTQDTIVLIWDKPTDSSDVTGYEIYKNNKLEGATTKGNYSVTGLSANRTYDFHVTAKRKDGSRSKPSTGIKASTRSIGRIIDIRKHGAKGDGITLNTKAIQATIDACPPNGTVLIPEGRFLSGAIHLKSDMTLLVNGTLLGSVNPEDYKPLTYQTFGGRYLNCFQSLINAGKYDENGGPNCRNITIQGSGKIRGGGSNLGKAQEKAAGYYTRGRLICLKNCEDVYLADFKASNSASWNIHMIFCDGITTDGIDVNSEGIPNGDGWNPDSSTNCYIFNSTFNTGDDCIAIKAGKGLKGYQIGRPSKNIRITDCHFVSGHSLAIGSETGGGIEDVIIQDCTVGNLGYGIQMKSHPTRGGYIKNITVKDCSCKSVTFFMKVPYNNDGDPAPVLPEFSNMSFSNLDMTGGSGKIIQMHGLDKSSIKDIKFSNIRCPNNATITGTHCDRVIFKNVTTANGSPPPLFKFSHSQQIKNEHKFIAPPLPPLNNVPPKKNSSH